MVAYRPYWEVSTIVRIKIKIKYDVGFHYLRTILCGEPSLPRKLQLVLSILCSIKSFDQIHLAIYIYTIIFNIRT